MLWNCCRHNNPGELGSTSLTILHLHYAYYVYVSIKPILGLFEETYLSFQKKIHCKNEVMLLFFLLYGVLWKCVLWNLNEAILSNPLLQLNAKELVLERWKHSLILNVSELTKFLCCFWKDLCWSIYDMYIISEKWSVACALVHFLFLSVKTFCCKCSCGLCYKPQYYRLLQSILNLFTGSLEV
jgi:hypothetical protein